MVVDVWTMLCWNVGGSCSNFFLQFGNTCLPSIVQVMADIWAILYCDKGSASDDARSRLLAEDGLTPRNNNNNNNGCYQWSTDYVYFIIKKRRGLLSSARIAFTEEILMILLRCGDDIYAVYYSIWRGDECLLLSVSAWLCHPPNCGEKDVWLYIHTLSLIALRGILTLQECAWKFYRN